MQGIHPLGPQDRAAVEALCSTSPAYDLFLLANLDQLSRTGDLVEYWGQRDDAGRLAGVLMRYNTLWYFHDEEGVDLAAFARVIEDFRHPRLVVNENSRRGRLLHPLLQGYSPVLHLPGRLRLLPADRSAELPPVAVENARVRLAGVGDVDRLSDFYAGAPADVRRGPDSVRRSIGGGRRTYLVEDGQGASTAAALTTAELAHLAMAGGLHASAEGARLGHLTAALGVLASALAAEGKDTCIVVRDPQVAEVCDKLGFLDAGPWDMVHLTRD